MSIRSSWLMVLLSYSVCLMIFCLVVLSIVVREVPKSPSVIVDFSVFQFYCSSVVWCITHLKNSP